MICYGAAIVLPLWAVLATSVATDEALSNAGGDLVSSRPR